jgi:hypothetical protein
MLSYSKIVNKSEYLAQVGDVMGNLEVAECSGSLGVNNPFWSNVIKLFTSVIDEFSE